MIHVKAQEILKNVKRLQNGEVSRAMKKMGILYETNYGVSIPQLRQLANQYEANSEVAQQLWTSDIREGKIMASMLFDTRSISLKHMVEISEGIVNLELVEQLAKNTFAPYIQLHQLLSELIAGNHWQQLAALYAAAWHIKRITPINDKLAAWSIEQISIFHNHQEVLLQKAAGFLFQSVASINNDYKSEMVILAEQMMKSEDRSVQIFAQEFLWLNMT